MHIARWQKAARYNRAVAHRFYAPDAVKTGDTVSLPHDEADHLRRVLRLRAGDEVQVFDGRGAEYVARVASGESDRVVVTLGDRVTPAPELHTRITLAQSVLKGDKMDDVVRDAVMLGVVAVQPVVSARTEVAMSASAARVDRWTRIATASTKQCGRASLARIFPPVSVGEWFETRTDEMGIMLVEPRAAAGTRRVRDLQTRAPRTASVLVGPEGGWTQDEVERGIASGATLVTLGDRTLRADAAPLVLLSMLLMAWD